ncbi:transglutaminase N-terminal domain-containing protein [Alteromonas macleodii]|uniref:transglutaminase N-terminal domain-containing protein n=1 Tax=Alteromonas macleodii TaxID=28108 RepID=UPI001E592A79|nr:transglutaminase N-terminal domain-containing protein [Alteromonas macleodii]
MTITVGITHHTEYHYDKSISMSPHTFRLRPAPHSRTPIKSYSLKVFPEDHFINWQQDPFGNYLARVVFPEKTKKFSFTVDLVAELTVINPFDFFLESYAETYPFKYEKRLARDLAPYLGPVDLCCTYFTQQYIGSHIIENASDTILA